MFFFAVIILCTVATNNILAAGVFSSYHKQEPEEKPETAPAIPFEQRCTHSYFRSGQTTVEKIITEALKHDPGLQKKPAVDVGCGPGHLTIHFVEHGFINMVGFDIDETSIEYASRRYDENRYLEDPKKSRFKVINILEPNTYKEPFSFLSLLHVACEFNFKKPLLTQLYSMAAPGAILAIVDFAHTRQEHAHCLYNYEGLPDHPLLIDSFTDDLVTTGWEVLTLQNVTADFIASCKRIKRFLTRQFEKSTPIASPPTIVHDYTTLSNLQKQLTEGILAGVMILAQKPKE